MTHKRLLKTPDDWASFASALKHEGIDPGIYESQPDSYPAIAIWYEQDIDSMRYGWAAHGDYAYLSDFESEEPLELTSDGYSRPR